MYRSGFNSEFVEKRPVSVPSHSSGPVSSLPRGHHTCRLLHISNIAHRDMPRSPGGGGSGTVGGQKERDGGARRRGRKGLEAVAWEEEGVRGGGEEIKDQEKKVEKVIVCVWGGE